MRRLAIARLVAPVLLQGCAGTPVVSSYNLVTPPPRQYELAAALGGSEVPVAVTASPFAGVSPPQLAALVTGAMPRLCGARYVAVAAAEPAPRGITWSFAGGAALEADVLLTAPPRGRLSEVRGTLAVPPDAQDPAFTALVRQMTMTLLRPCL